MSNTEDRHNSWRLTSHYIDTTASLRCRSQGNGDLVSLDGLELLQWARWTEEPA